ncbi:BrnA antitoxin family protein [Geminocystis sp. CENA526]|uniref:BrnA antitoxin family protein n=1 Tax=Geminocystis sp. CENA526 TaxID=1355871 RepID=UPI003D6F975F
MTDWEKLESMTDENIDFSDCPEITPEMAKNSIVRRGLQSSKKQSLTLSLDAEIVHWYKQNEVDHQTEINKVLREYLKNN